MADSSKDIQLRELKDMIHDLQKMIKTLQVTVDAANKREEALTQERDNLKEEVDLLRKKLFGTSSEKRVLDIPGQLNFFNEAELEQDPALAQVEELELCTLDWSFSFLYLMARGKNITCHHQIYLLPTVISITVPYLL